MFKPTTKCQQCGKRLSAEDRRLGTVCTPCVHGNHGRVFGNDADDDYEDGE